MDRPDIPDDLKIEILLNHLPENKTTVELCGSHKRNAYQDILEVNIEDGLYNISICRDSLYDILPEGLFHYVERFKDLPIYGYQEAFAEECEQQRQEEINARRYFKPFDIFLIKLNCLISYLEDNDYSDSTALLKIIGDSIPASCLNNRFISKVYSFIPLSNRIRGDKTLLSLMLRKIFFDEGMRLEINESNEVFTDTSPRYNHCLDDHSELDNKTYLGTEFIDNIITYDIYLWNDSECNSDFLNYISEIKVFETFVNDWFTGIETTLKFNVMTDAHQAGLSDEHNCNYLSYNTNL